MTIFTIPGLVRQRKVRRLGFIAIYDLMKEIKALWISNEFPSREELEELTTEAQTLRHYMTNEE